MPPGALEYLPRRVEAPVAMWTLRGWAVVNWLGAVAAVCICAFLIARWGWPALVRTPLLFGIVILTDSSFVITLSTWGLQCWWYGNSARDGDLLNLRRARIMTTLLCLLWLSCTGGLLALRLTYSAPRFDPAERIGWWIVGSATTAFAAGALITAVVLSPTLLRRSVSVVQRAGE